MCQIRFAAVCDKRQGLMRTWKSQRDEGGTDLESSPWIMRPHRTSCWTAPSNASSKFHRKWGSGLFRVGWVDNNSRLPTHDPLKVIQTHTPNPSFHRGVIDPANLDIPRRTELPPPPVSQKPRYRHPQRPTAHNLVWIFDAAGRGYEMTESREAVGCHSNHSPSVIHPGFRLPLLRE